MGATLHSEYASTHFLRMILSVFNCFRNRSTDSVCSSHRAHGCFAGYSGCFPLFDSVIGFAIHSRKSSSASKISRQLLPIGTSRDSLDSLGNRKPSLLVRSCNRLMNDRSIVTTSSRRRGKQAGDAWWREPNTSSTSRVGSLTLHLVLMQ